MISEDVRIVLSLILIMIGIDLMAKLFVSNLKMRGFKKKLKTHAEADASDQPPSGDSSSSTQMPRPQ